ncbi:MAG: serine/threonine protein kinase [Chloroflexota bacterium]|nr:serine/threonine protein kinase [Chloroflexota bacterium]
MSERTLRRIGNYRLIQLLGQGGFARVYLGEHIHLNTHAAIKILNTHLDRQDIIDFRKEARIVAHLRHPHIVSMLDFGVEDDEPFLVMDYAPNGTLRQRHPRGSRLAPTTILPYLLNVGSALQFAHNERLIHRDVKPENMLIGRQGGILLSDFGIAFNMLSSHSESTNIAGTVVYMAPEQLRGKPRPASDQYTLAVIVYEWLCGQRPFTGSVAEVMAQHLNAEPPSLSLLVPVIPPALDKVVLTALSKHPADRYASVWDFVQAFQYTCSAPVRPQRRFSSPSLPVSPPHPRSPQAPPSPPSQPADADSEEVAEELGVSRRTLLTRLAGVGMIAAVGGGIWWLTHMPSQGPNFVGVGPATTPTATPIPLGTTLLTYTGHKDVVNTVAWSYDGRYIASGSNDTTVQVWDAVTGQPIYTYTKHRDVVLSVTWSPDGKYVASGSLDGTVQVWPALTGQSPVILKGTYSCWSPISNATRIATTDIGTGKVQIYDATTGNPIGGPYQPAIAPAYAIAWSFDGRRIATGGGSNSSESVEIWDIVNNGKVGSHNGQSAGVFTIAWEYNNTQLASGGFNKTVQIWEFGTDKVVFAYEHNAQVNSIIWSSDGTRIASGSDDNTVQIWNPVSRNRIYTYQEHTDHVRTITWSPRDTRIASASADKTVKVWQAQ